MVLHLSLPDPTLQQTEPVGMLVLDQDMIDSVLAANARGLGVALPDNHSGRLVQTVAKHIERWVSLELQ
jgi:ABC-type Fe3+-citrate transport system substrate-binding protein